MKLPLLWLFLTLRGLLPRAMAQVFDGPGLEGGVDVATLIDGPLHGTLRFVILEFFYKALGFLALAAVVMVVAAGFYMVVGQGAEDSKEKAKKIILYVVIGLIIVFVARSVVGLFLNGIQ
ncbi:hypothetical protein EXS70_01630 [Candidatus Peribacteria bacterium]|nr:hypothetical protein [Candidatus Peribacteria bacterium]